ncbi:intradiol ring-cleavage dioxygenase [Hephaestia mangrovi]|uniref:intradiol ring-cleavage dioxygenase n=1 Tax=Hephaestia mangrovi TaxID=2873268 RepID=UPI001CA69027|nr:intradiol ring-cleavage dioxygenase [Hephaestia mangrovi]MBY8829402.1 intradiol ring-cleavage dioxygenase [Hephaestia mangrovi]
MPDPHAHAHGLSYDLEAMRSLIARRRVLRLFAGTGAVALLGGCGGDSGASSDGDISVVDTSPTPAPTPTATATPTPTPTSSTTTCIADPEETAGPYPADGTNTASGSTSNVLTISGIERSDIRSSFISSTTVASGTKLTITLTLVDSNASCAPLAGYALYLWHCDNEGHYSLYSAPSESYLRGIQVTDSNGQATFVTNFPACYSGRWPHIHFEVYSSLSNATSGRYALLTSQLCMPEAICDTVYADSSLYPSSATRLASITLSSDNVFGDNTAAQIAQQTPAVGGSVSSGLTASATIGLAT